MGALYMAGHGIERDLGKAGELVLSASLLVAGNLSGQNDEIRHAWHTARVQDATMPPSHALMILAPGRDT
jgi:hypothetical protein